MPTLARRAFGSCGDLYGHIAQTAINHTYNLFKFYERTAVNVNFMVGREAEHIAHSCHWLNSDNSHAGEKTRTLERE